MIEFDDAQDEVENLNNELGSAYIGISRETNRYRDFQAVYKTSAGKRVLREIMWWGHINLPSVSKSIPVDPYRTHVYEGHRELALEIQKVLLKKPVEPQDKPTKTRSKFYKGVDHG